MSSGPTICCAIGTGVRIRITRQPALACRDARALAADLLPRRDTGQIRGGVARVRRRRRSQWVDLHRCRRRRASSLAAGQGMDVCGARRSGERKAAVRDGRSSAAHPPAGVSRAGSGCVPPPVCVLQTPTCGAARRGTHRAGRGRGGADRRERVGALQAPPCRFRPVFPRRSTRLCRAGSPGPPEGDGRTHVGGTAFKRCTALASQFPGSRDSSRAGTFWRFVTRTSAARECRSTGGARRMPPDRIPGSPRRSTRAGPGCAQTGTPRRNLEAGAVRR